MEQIGRWIKQEIIISSEVFRSIAKTCTKDILKTSDMIISAINKGNKIFWCGNGGSAAQAQHLSTELVCGLRSHERIALPSISLTTDTSMITAWSNDTDFSTIFSRQIEALGKTGDVLIAISTSGNSKNIVEAVKKAKKKGIITIGFIGNRKCEMRKICDLDISVPSTDTQRIQEGHILIGHIICEIVEREFLNNSY